MKWLVSFVLAAGLLAGCGGEVDLDDKETLDEIIAEAIDLEKVQIRGEGDEELAYAPNQQMPYTGWVKTMRENGQIRKLFQCKDGKEHGLFFWWYENGQKEREILWKGDKENGLWTEWYENGQKRMREPYKDGKLDGLVTWWYENGQKEAEYTYKDGKVWTAVAWKPNGEKCPHTNLKDGNGVVVNYNNDGTEDWRQTYKDGERPLNPSNRPWDPGALRQAMD